MTERERDGRDAANGWVGVLALSATVIARGLAVALPGATEGIERWIENTRLAGAVLSQATVVFGATAAIGLLLSTLWRRALSYWYRVLAVPATAVILTLVALSVRLPLHPFETRILGGTGVALALAASALALVAPLSRAAGLVLLFAALAGGGQLAAHALATIQGGFGAQEWARAVATFGFLCDAMSLVLATAWLVSKRRNVTRGAVLAVGSIAAIVAWGATMGSSDGAALWQVLASKAFAELLASPAPHVASIASYWVDAYGFGLSALLLTAPKWTGTTPTAMCLALLVRGDPDVPLCALMLALSALFTALQASNGQRAPVAGVGADQEATGEFSAIDGEPAADISSAYPQQEATLRNV
jgi:hypothetical protein